MAIAATLVTGKTSHFRMTTFVNSAPQPPNASSNLLHSPVVTRDSDTKRPVTGNLDSIFMAHQSSRPSSGQVVDRTPSIAPAHDSLEVVDSTSLLLEANKDGRVRNPVPSKLKGKTDNKQGNFSVMHMGMSPGGKKSETQGRDAAAERDAAARRTSENTASRAKAAQQGKYVPPRQRGLEGTDRASPFATGDKQRGRPLAPDDTKQEQARLLTLLRSINPVTVVDQICKAVAYFGGIPGAPPPEDGIFPESANTRETGALFIGWLSEIFPDLSSPEVPRMQPPPTGVKKKGKAKIEMPPDEPPNPRNGFGFGQAVSAPAWGLPQSLSLVNTVGLGVTPNVGQAPSTVGVDSNAQVEPPQQLPPATPAKKLPEGSATNASGSKRGRGRPKGSTNKNRKSGALGSGDVSASIDTDGQNHVVAGQPVLQTSQAPGKSLNPPEQNQTSYIKIPANQTGVSSEPHGIQYPPQPWQTEMTKVNTAAASKSNAIDDMSPEELAVLNAFRQPGALGTASMTSNTKSAPLPVQNTAGAGSGVKRKRAPAKPKQPAAVPTAQAASNTVGDHQMPAQSNQTAQYTPILPPSKNLSAGMTKDALQWSPADTATPTVPPPKRPRQRKPKASAADPPSRQQTVSIVSQPTPPTMPSTIPDSQATASQQSIAVTRPPAEGLEAHYERFATSSVPQQNGRSHTPSTSVTSITPQQHLRQLQKPTSVPQSQQQSPAQTNTQLQMQRQKSQQSQREEQQKMASATTARSTSTGFYNQQQRQSTYGTQQYPAHQTSQLNYGTHNTATPQMSNNSYRTGPTHTMAQPSPQFSQSDNTYRTSSPHTNTIAQPSPSFTQPESNFRTPSTHSIPQPSPTYSQPENPYRTSSLTNTSLATSSLTNPTPSYSRTPQTQTQTSHQSHYGHFPDATSYVDLPTLESLGHSGGSSNTLSAAGYGQQSLGVGLGGSSSASRSGSHSLYGTSSGLGSAFDTGTNDLLRGVSRGGGAGSAYGTSSGLGSFDTEQDMRERMMRMGGGRR